MQVHIVFSKKIQQMFFGNMEIGATKILTSSLENFFLAS